MENYTENLKEYLKERRNISKRLYKLIGTTFRRVQKGRTTWENIIKLMGGNI